MLFHERFSWAVPLYSKKAKYCFIVSSPTKKIPGIIPGILVSEPILFVYFLISFSDFLSWL